MKKTGTTQQPSERKLFTVSIFIYAEYMLDKTRLEENEPGFKTGRNINNKCCTSILIAENANGLQALIMKVKNYNKKRLWLNIKNTLLMI